MGIEEYWKWVEECYKPNPGHKPNPVDCVVVGKDPLASPWIDVREKLPEHGQKVLIKVRNGTVTAAEVDRKSYLDVKVDWDPVGVTGYDVEWEWSTDYKDPYRSVTHWMPLPDA